MKRKLFMATLSFELTRKCNLKCKWCSRGEAQNVNITKEIIDKTLDEVQEFYIYEIRITGGEPMLNPDMFLYLAEQIVKRKIKVSTIYAITNGTIQNEKIKEALILLSDYLKKTEYKHWRRESENFFTSIKLENLYPQTNDKDVLLSISTYEHDNTEFIKQTKEYYNINKDNYIVLMQDEYLSNIGTITMEGLAQKNYKSFSTEELRNIRKMYNKYCIVVDDIENDSNIYISKTLTVSANGNVFCGGMQSYNNVDSESMFNILDCNKNFYSHVDEWCWMNPINYRERMYYEMYLSRKWQKIHNIHYDEKGMRDELLDTIISCIDLHRKESIQNHMLFPCLNHRELNLFTVLYTIFCAMNESGIDKISNIMNVFLQICEFLNDDFIAELNKEKLAMICNHLISINNEREKQEISKFKGGIYHA